MSRNGPITTELLLTEFALMSHDSILSLREKTEKQADVLRLHCNLQADAIWTTRTGRKRAVGSVISGDLAPCRPDVEQRIEKSLDCTALMRVKMLDVLTTIGI